MTRTYLYALIVAALIITACTVTPPGPTPGGNGGTPSGGTQLQGSQELKKFSTTEDLKAFLQQNAGGGSYGYYGGSRNVLMAETAVAAPTAAADKTAGASAPSAGSADTYSQTNVQVAGVDEADFVKNDDKYIYVIAGGKLVIIDAHPAEKMKRLSETQLDGQPQELFLNGDRLVVFTLGNDEEYGLDQYEFIPVPRYYQRTHLLVYDVTDRSEPKLLHDFKVHGNYFQARMIGDYVYLLTQEYASYDIDPPRILETRGTATTTLVKPDVYYFDNPEENYQYTTVSSFDIMAETPKVEGKTFLMGYANTVYVSQENIYVSYQKNLPWQDEREKRFYDAVVPALPLATQDKIEQIKSEHLSKAEEWDKVSTAVEDLYDSLSKADRQDLIKKVQVATEEYDLQRAKEQMKSIIHKIAVDNGQITYVEKGEVPGQLLNQFSLDENGGKLRVATTSYLYTRSGSTMYNNVYVLSSNMETVGSLEELAPDERIYSTRFVGDRLYMVTFKRMDPLFVIDLSANQPKVLGKLKIPGFSDYLHPYDATHLIGVGKETADNEWGGVSVKGVKVALFDVSDVENPKQVDAIEIGTSGSDSEALRDHKAFLFDKEKNLLVIPVREVKESYSYDNMPCRVGVACYPYRQRVWEGAYVLKVTADSITKQGKVSHIDDYDEDYYSWWNSQYAVRRSLYMDDVLYTVSNALVKANSLATLDDISEVKLPHDSYGYPYPVPMMETAVVK